MSLLQTTGFLARAGLCLALAGGLSTPTETRAERVEVVKVRATHDNIGWRFSVTLSHPDSGWEHFADGWEVLDGNGRRIAYRELMHPHVDEQPFTRSLPSVMIPDGMRVVFIRPRCNRDGWSKETVAVRLVR